jgi:myo-inositol-1(or 4)-monophosphatase
VPLRETLRELALAAADAAGRIVADSRSDPEALRPQLKATGDYVTAVDRAAEGAAISVLREGTPEIAVLAEESGGSRDERMWVIDPVDGTTNLLRGYPEVGVSIALIEDGRPVVGAIVAPLTGEAWTAALGGGAANRAGRPVRVSARVDGHVVATGFPFRRKEPNLGRYLPVLEAALWRFEDLRRPGAASLDLAYSAAGVWDGFFELGLALWDIAAGSLLVTEAGGVVSDWRGDPAAVYLSGDILAGSPTWHDAMLGIIAAAGLS